MNKQLSIVCAACKHEDGRLIIGPRHFDHTMWAILCGMTLEAFNAMIANPDHATSDAVKGWANAEQGFIDQHGKFYTREEAWVIAEAADQILLEEKGWQKGSLHSEHLY